MAVKQTVNVGALFIVCIHSVENLGLKGALDNAGAPLKECSGEGLWQSPFQFAWIVA